MDEEKRGGLSTQQQHPFMTVRRRRRKRRKEGRREGGREGEVKQEGEEGGGGWWGGTREGGGASEWEWGKGCSSLNQRPPLLPSPPFPPKKQKQSARFLLWQATNRIHLPLPSSAPSWTKPRSSCGPTIYSWLLKISTTSSLVHMLSYIHLYVIRWPTSLWVKS